MATTLAETAVGTVGATVASERAACERLPKPTDGGGAHERKPLNCYPRND